VRGGGGRQAGSTRTVAQHRAETEVAAHPHPVETPSDLRLRNCPHRRHALARPHPQQAFPKGQVSHPGGLVSLPLPVVHRHVDYEHVNHVGETERRHQRQLSAQAPGADGRGLWLRAGAAGSQAAGRQHAVREEGACPLGATVVNVSW
jgi:hypothetical protein